jgi:hypothetical protein
MTLYTRFIYPSTVSSTIVRDASYCHIPATKVRGVIISCIPGTIVGGVPCSGIPDTIAGDTRTFGVVLRCTLYYRKK